MEPESKKPDIILNDKQKHSVELELHSRNPSSTAAKNVTTMHQPLAPEPPSCPAGS